MITMHIETSAAGVTYHYPREAADITPAMLKLAEEVYDSWFSDDERIDWDEFQDRMAAWSLMQDPPWEFDETTNPAMDKIKRHIRAYRDGT